MDERVQQELEGCPGRPLIEMLGIDKIYKNAAGEFTALKNIDICFYEGEFVSVVGKSGSGKSTLANMITGIDHPTSGSVRIGGIPIHQLGESQMAAWRGKNLGIVFQFFQLLPTLTVLENVLLPMDFCNVYEPGEREGRALELLRLVGLEEFAQDLPAALSGGQQQTAAIARALANDPPILIADEPTGNLDSRTAESVFEIFDQLVARGKTIIMVTHDSSLARRTQRMMILSDGELVNEWVGRAFPGLSHNQMLWLSHNARPRQVEPGEVVARSNGSDPGLLVVTGGQLEVALAGGAGRNGSGGPVVQLRPGDYFCGQELQAGGFLIQAVRGSAAGPVEVLELSRSELEAWMQTAPEVKASLCQAAEERAEFYAAQVDPAASEGKL